MKGLLGGFVSALMALLPVPAVGQAPSTGAPQVRTLSSRANFITGGDALIEIVDPRRNGDTNSITVTVNGADSSTVFKRGPSGSTWLGLVTNLKEGANQIAVGLHGQKPLAHMTVVNHPITGPVISGPHQRPFVCETEGFGLGKSTDDNCTATTRVDYFYRSSAALQAASSPSEGRDRNPFKRFREADPRPLDLALTTTLGGKQVPYIVRREMGTINRAVYAIAFLHEPGTPLPDPWTTDAWWNGRLLYSFGGGCRPGYHQGSTIGGLDAEREYLGDLMLGDYALGKGYAIAAASLNVFRTSCNDVTSAETLMMVKEHFTERYGAPRYTIGAGGSGGSMQVQQIANNYPGLLDGILPFISFPDPITFLQPLLDCEVLNHAFDVSASSGITWSIEQKQAVDGHRTWDWCRNNPRRFPLLRPSACDAAVPEAQRYHTATNQNGARCTYQDNLVNVYGRDPKNGYARRPFDNVGVQYGLSALNAGVITFDQFVALNRSIGGFDIDGNLITQRAAGDASAIRIAHATGRVNHGNNLEGTPIINVHRYRDQVGDIHDLLPMWIMRARIIAAHGDASNHIAIVVEDTDSSDEGLGDGRTPFERALRVALDDMDEWLGAITSDHRIARHVRERVSRNKPKRLIDACIVVDGRIVSDAAECQRLFPRGSNARISAGEPLAADRLKCALKRVSAGDYQMELTRKQLSTLASVFPTGVCDYGRKGPNETSGNSWRSYSSSQSPTTLIRAHYPRF